MVENIMPEQSNIDPHNLLEDLLPLESCKKLFVIVLVTQLLIQSEAGHRVFGLLDHCQSPNLHPNGF